MDAEQSKALRAPFPPEMVGKLPKVTCSDCSKKQCRNQGHKASRCDVCKAWITPAHLHLDYVGHAELTDRLLSVDPDWDWQPMALDERGLPLFDQHGGMWIKLTIFDQTRLGYGDAQGKNGPNAVKEAIGDALRNAGMRFGLALDLWAKSDLAALHAEKETGEIAFDEWWEGWTHAVAKSPSQDDLRSRWREAKQRVENNLLDARGWARAQELVTGRKAELDAIAAQESAGEPDASIPPAPAAPPGIDPQDQTPAAAPAEQPAATGSQEQPSPAPRSQPPGPAPAQPTADKPVVLSPDPIKNNGLRKGVLDSIKASCEVIGADFDTVVQGYAGGAVEYVETSDLRVMQTKLLAKANEIKAAAASGEQGSLV
jgi:hypothetical protein